MELCGRLVQIQGIVHGVLVKYKNKPGLKATWDEPPNTLHRMSLRTLFIGLAAALALVAVVVLLRPSGESDGRQPENDEAPPGLFDRARGDSGSRTFDPSAEVYTDTYDHVHDDPLLEIGTPAPNFELARLDGGTFSLSEQRGKVVLLNFWATWCEPCREELPALQQLWERYHADGLVVVGISMDEEGRPIVEEFHQTFPVEYPLLIDGLQVAETYRAHFVVPTSYLISRDGRIADRHIGVIDRDGFRPRVEALL